MHEDYLKIALEQATIRRGFCAPNPAVGAVVVKNNKIVATGYHWASGQPHAEVEALNKAGKEAKDATLYITLEPCCHWGKTPPCTDLIITSGIKNVIYGYPDPNPIVRNHSESLLKKSGIDSQHYSIPEMDQFYQSYQHWQTTGVPFVTVKLAMSLDGKIAGSEGNPIGITGQATQELTHKKRKISDAILTTARTICRDDPQLNIRLGEERYSKPIYILDSQLSIPPTAKLFKTAQKVTLFHRSSICPNPISGVNYVRVGYDEKGLNLTEVMKKIGNDGVHDLWVEAGGQCFTTIIESGLAQKALIYVAPKILGPNATPGFKENINIFKNAKGIFWNTVGDDVVCEIDLDKAQDLKLKKVEGGVIDERP